jgi:ribosomal protein L37AE/L43A
MRITPLTSADTRVAVDGDDLAAGFAPPCPACLRTPEPWETGRTAVWRCAGCGLALIG